MNHSMINSSVSMQSIQQKLDIIAHNISNANTLGFKRKESSFHDVLTSTMKQPEEFRQPGRLTNPGFTMGWGAKVGHIQTDMSQGTLQMTNNLLDIAIEGDALFEIQLTEEDMAQNPDGPDVAWTKQGSFQYTTQPDDPDNVYLTTTAGQFVRGVNDLPIAVPKNHRINVDSNGLIYAYNEVDREAPPEFVGQLKIVHVLRPQLLEQIGDKQFVLKDGVDNADGSVLQQLDVNEVDRPKVALRQGFVEQSNVELTVEMTELIQVQRAFQMNSRALSSSDTLMNLTNNLRGS
jgi:flagellar basal-body rod protein FlgG